MRLVMAYKTLVAALTLATAAFSQNLAGTWQGTLPTPQRELRLVMKIEQAADESLKGTLISIDQNGRGVPVAITRQGTTFKAAIAAIGANFEGKVSPDGAAINGTFTQNSSLPLNFVKATPTTQWAIPEPPPPPRLMADDAQPVFEVATIKPSNPDTPGQALNIGRGGGNAFTTLNMPLADLIRFAYAVHAQQLIGGPAWIESEKYDILAKPDTPGIPNAPQVRSMVQRLLKERFGLEFHRDKKELTAYLINADKAGVKMTKVEDARSKLPGFGQRGPGRMAVRNATMGEFADFLQARILDRPVVDKSGLTDRFDFSLEWRPVNNGPAAAGGNAPPAAQAADDRPDLFTAMREQLGLKLETGKTLVDVIVVDKVTKPTEN